MDALASAGGQYWSLYMLMREPKHIFVLVYYPPQDFEQWIVLQPRSPGWQIWAKRRVSLLTECLWLRAVTVGKMIGRCFLSLVSISFCLRTRPNWIVSLFCLGLQTSISKFCLHTSKEDMVHSPLVENLLSFHPSPFIPNWCQISIVQVCVCTSCCVQHSTSFVEKM